MMQDRVISPCCKYYGFAMGRDSYELVILVVFKEWMMIYSHQSVRQSRMRNIFKIINNRTLAYKRLWTTLSTLHA